MEFQPNVYPASLPFVCILKKANFYLQFETNTLNIVKHTFIYTIIADGNLSIYSQNSRGISPKTISPNGYSEKVIFTETHFIEQNVIEKQCPEKYLIINNKLNYKEPDTLAVVYQSLDQLHVKRLVCLAPCIVLEF